MERAPGDPSTSCCCIGSVATWANDHAQSRQKQASAPARYCRAVDEDRVWARPARRMFSATVRVGHQVQLLVNHHDAQGLRMAGPRASVTRPR